MAQWTRSILFFSWLSFLIATTGAQNSVFAMTSNLPSQPTLETCSPEQQASTAMVTGEKKTWHTLTFTFTEPETTSGTQSSMDVRFDVLFEHSASGKHYLIPGSLRKHHDLMEQREWRVSFVPDEIGTWSYTASLRTGNQVALSLDPCAGTAQASLTGMSDTFEVRKTDKQEPDFRARGRLAYVGSRYFQHQETGEYYIGGISDTFTLSSFSNKSDPETLLKLLFDQLNNEIDRTDNAVLYADIPVADIDFVQITDYQNMDGNLRIAYYRELVSHLGHELSLIWNLVPQDEVNLTKLQQDIDLLRQIDPYHHPIVIDAHAANVDDAFDLRQLDGLSGISFQDSFTPDHAYITMEQSIIPENGLQWSLLIDNLADSDPTSLFQEMMTSYDQLIWGVLMGGGSLTRRNLDPQQINTPNQKTSYDIASHAYAFLSSRHIPYWDMLPNDTATISGNGFENDYVLVKPGKVWAMYLPDGVTVNIANLETDIYEIFWYDVRQGGSLLRTDRTQMTGGRDNATGHAPNSEGYGWIVIVKQKDEPEIYSYPDVIDGYDFFQQTLTLDTYDDTLADNDEDNVPSGFLQSISQLIDFIKSLMPFKWIRELLGHSPLSQESLT